MNRIKKIEDIILGEYDLLLEVIKKNTKSGIITPNKDLGKPTGTEYGVVRAKGTRVEDLEIGDIILKTRIEGAPGFKYDERELVLISRHQVMIAVKPVNFNASDEISA